VLDIQIAAGSAAGRLHTLLGRNNQDAFAWARTPDAVVAVVCDGCGSSPHAETGAQIGARLVARALATRLAQGADPRRPEMWSEARAEVLDTIAGLAGVLGGDPAAAVADYLLFTIIGAVITEDVVRCFSSGDGLIVVDGAPTVIGPFPDNAPPYLAYALFEEQGEKYQFELTEPVAASGVSSILIGTDGAADLLRIEHRDVPGGGGKVGPLSRFWTDDRFFDEPDSLEGHLAALARDVERADWEKRALETDPGLLLDDTTVVVLRRPSGD